MPVYRSIDQLYDCLDTLFDQIINSGQYDLSSLERSKLVTRFHLSNPSGELVIDGSTRPISTHLGPSTIKCNLEVTLETDLFHQIMLGEAGILKSFGRRKIKAKGPIHKTSSLSDLFVKSQELYPKILREKGVI